jgi:hypothetical protein
MGEETELDQKDHMKDEEWKSHELSQQQLEKPYKKPVKK